MTPLTTITGLHADAADLLAAAGIRSTAQLAREQAAVLHSRLELIAWQRGRAVQAPTVEQLQHWISVAVMLTPAGGAEVLSIDEIPEAVPTPAPAWVPPSLRAEQAAPGSAPLASEPLRAAPQPDNSWRKVDPKNFATIEDYNEGRIGITPLSRESLSAAPAEDEEPIDEPVSRRPQRIRSSGEELSRWIRRGVVHPRPVHTWLGAFVSVLWRLAALSGIAGFVYLLVEVEHPGDYKLEVIAGFIVLVILGCMQLHFAGRARCRICSCNLYHSKNCLKNRKAHLIPGFGYVASLALHLLIFGWFRCMYCGTAIRLRPTVRPGQ